MTSTRGCFGESNLGKRKRGNPVWGGFGAEASPIKHSRVEKNTEEEADSRGAREESWESETRKVWPDAVHYSTEYYDDILRVLDREPTPGDKVLIASGIELTFGKFLELEGPELRSAFPIMMVAGKAAGLHLSLF